MKYIDRLKNKFRKKKVPTIVDSDTFLVSYPKSGNSWVRFMIANIMSGEKVDFTSVQKYCPEYETQQELLLNLRGENPRFIKSHSPNNPKFKKVVYLVRDVRDVAVSYFYHYKKFSTQNQNLLFEDFLQLFFSGDLQFGDWKSHVENWTNLSIDNRKVLVVKYEDLLENTFSSIKEIVNFSSINADEEAIKMAIENSSFKNLQKIEKKDQLTNSILKNSDPKINFIRRGKSGGFKEEMTESMQIAFWKRYGKTLKQFGYKEK